MASKFNSASKKDDCIKSTLVVHHATHCTWHHHCISQRKNFLMTYIVQVPLYLPYFVTKLDAVRNHPFDKSNLPSFNNCLALIPSGEAERNRSVSSPGFQRPSLLQVGEEGRVAHAEGILQQGRFVHSLGKNGITRHQDHCRTRTATR